MNFNSHPNPVEYARRSYLWWFGLSMIAYVVAILFSRMVLNAHSIPGSWDTTVAVLPIFPVIFVFVAIVRFVRGTDELQRQSSIPWPSPGVPRPS